MGTIAGSKDIDGMQALAFRVSEGLCRTANAAAKEMADWKNLRFWRDEVPRHAATFLFGVAVILRRRIVVIEEDKHGHLIDPARVYGARDQNGALVRAAGTQISPPILPAYTDLNFSDLRARLQAETEAWIQTGHDPKHLSHPVRPHSEALHGVGAKDSTLLNDLQTGSDRDSSCPPVAPLPNRETSEGRGRSSASPSAPA